MSRKLATITILFILLVSCATADYDLGVSSSGERVQTPYSTTVGLSGNVNYLCDGTADDAQIQAAIDAVDTAGGGTVLIREGNYQITSEITISGNNPIKIIGTKNAVFLQVEGAGVNCFVIGETDHTSNGIEISDLKIYGRHNGFSYGAVTTGSLIKGTNLIKCKFDNLYLRYSAKAIELTTGGTSYSSLCKFSNVDIIQCTDGIYINNYQGGSTANNYNNAHTFNAVNVAECTTGVYIERVHATLSGEVSHHKFVNCYIESSTGTDVLIDATLAQKLHLISCSFDGVAGNDMVVLDTVTNSHFIACSFDCDISETSCTGNVFSYDNEIVSTSGVKYLVPSTSSESALIISKSGTGKGIYAYDSNADGILCKLEATQAKTASPILNIVMPASSTQALAYLTNAGTGKSIYIDCQGNAKGIDIDSSASSAAGIDIAMSDTSKTAITTNGIIVAASISCSPTITSGSGAPSSTPAKIGDMYIDTSTPALYFAKGTSSSADWAAS